MCGRGEREREKKWIGVSDLLGDGGWQSGKEIQKEEDDGEKRYGIGTGWGRSRGRRRGRYLDYIDFYTQNGLG